MKNGVTACFVVFLIFFLSDGVSAAMMTGKSLRLNLQFKTQTSTFSGTVTPGESPKPGEEENPEIEKNLYSLTIGYNSTDNSPLGIALSPKTLDFGNLNPTTAVTRLQTVSIQKGPVPVYTLYISEDHTPQDASGSGKFVPNTTGDKDKITISKSGYWISPLTYGFGYRARGSENPPLLGFENEDTYKQLPSLENGLPREPIVKNSQKDDKYTVILKMNINNTQTDTNFENTIYYTLIPSL